MPEESKIVKFPNCPIKASKSVRAVFRKMFKKSEEQGWTKVIILGRGKNSGSWHYSVMDEDTALGMLEKLKHFIVTAPEI